jgi:hypothetical protein
LFARARVREKDPAPEEMKREYGFGDFGRRGRKASAMTAQPITLTDVQAWKRE